MVDVRVLRGVKAASDLGLLCLVLEGERLGGLVGELERLSVEFHGGGVVGGSVGAPADAPADAPAGAPENSPGDVPTDVPENAHTGTEKQPAKDVGKPVTIRLTPETGKVNVLPTPTGDDDAFTVTCLDSDVLMVLTEAGRAMRMSARWFRDGKRISELFRGVEDTDSVVFFGRFNTGDVIIPITVRGLCKHVSVKRVFPERFTSRNRRSSFAYTGLSGNTDKVSMVAVYNPAREGVTSIVAELSTHPKRGLRLQSVDMGNLLSRDDSRDSSGARFLSTENGSVAYDTISVSVVQR